MNNVRILTVFEGHPDALSDEFWIGNHTDVGFENALVPFERRRGDRTIPSQSRTNSSVYRATFVSKEELERCHVKYIVKMYVPPSDFKETRRAMKKKSNTPPAW